jgi:hypothetical protein
MPRNRDNPAEGRARAEARFQQARRAERERDARLADEQAAAKERDANTARLKALRLARDKAEAEGEDKPTTPEARGLRC